MYKRTTFETIKDFLNHYFGIIIILCSILVFAIVFFFFKTLFKPLTENQFALCEQVIHDVYEQKIYNIDEIPDGIVIEKNSTAITVRLNDDFTYGKIIAKLQDGELVTTRDYETIYTFLYSIIISLFIVVLIWFILIIILI